MREHDEHGVANWDWTWNVDTPTAPWRKELQTRQARSLPAVFSWKLAV